MANLLGGTAGVVVTWPKVVDYSRIEGALQLVGFTDYQIDRNVIGDTTEANINVHVPMRLITAEGVPDMDAVSVLRSLADAIEDIDDAG
ncbi:hypothetical protein D0Z08_19860 [Nocardioides immobilis]|uniref:Uncharacterized protein n=1 Tax=Nocardioides immobilis TaxID=2049295 RepID=A0A417XY35_9ACTN|nr:hypothetical protein [Nocardioides immobilis]RHW25221.1 hypothetical protein D0Z08_19860 [Nocardioides immobilis]